MTNINSKNTLIQNTMITINSNGQPTNKYGQPLRTKDTHPYNYDPITQYIAQDLDLDADLKRLHTVYSDRMLQWDYNKCRQSQTKIFNKTSDNYSNYSPDQIQAFLQEYFQDTTIKITKIEEHCNQATGYPLWLFQYISDK